jgi:hypothetical protein
MKFLKLTNEELKVLIETLLAEYGSTDYFVDIRNTKADDCNRVQRTYVKATCIKTRVGCELEN